MKTNKIIIATTMYTLGLLISCTNNVQQEHTLTQQEDNQEDVYNERSSTDSSDEDWDEYITALESAVNDYMSEIESPDNSSNEDNSLMEIQLLEDKLMIAKRNGELSGLQVIKLSQTQQKLNAISVGAL